jgi:hypothetical protein
MILKYLPDFLPQAQKFIFESIKWTINSLNQLFSEMLSILYVSIVSAENSEEFSQIQKYIYLIFSSSD